MKSFCTIHCFHYSGNVCPFCEKDRIASLAKRHVKKEDNPKITNDVKKPAEPEKTMEEMLSALTAKFNNKKY